MEAFLEVFGKMTIASAVVTVSAVFFLWRLFCTVKDQITERYEKEREKDEKIQTCLNQIEQYPAWRKQSLDMQKQFTEAIESLNEKQGKMAEKLDEIEAINRKRERNKLRDRLLQSHRYYTSQDKNPMLAWSEMEADAFWKMFGDYEEAGGNGHMRSEVQPAMRLLEVIPMHETEKITELMQSRR